MEWARERGEFAPEVDGETLLDLANGAAYYRLLWRGEARSPRTTKSHWSISSSPERPQGGRPTVSATRRGVKHLGKR